MKTKRQEQKEQAQRMALVSGACADEIARFNLAVDRADAQGQKITIKTHSGTYRVCYMQTSFDLKTVALNDSPRSMFTQTWALANDDRWAGLLAQAGVARNPLFA